MTDRLERIESRLEALTVVVRDLQYRVVALEAARGARPETAPAPPREPDIERLEAEDTEPAPLASALALLGRSLLVLGGAFLIRMVTENGTIPPWAGVAAGILYAAVWLWLADRAAGRGAQLESVFLGVSALLIACPLLWEATTRFRMIVAEPAFAILALLSISGLWVGARHGSKWLAWAFTLFPIGTAIALFEAPRSLVPLLFFLLGIAAATSWLAAVRPIRGPRWAAAFFADFAVVALVQIAARPGGPGENYPELTLPLAILLALILPAVELLRVSEGAIQGRGPTSLFDAVQCVVAVAVGLGGALQIAGAGPARVPIAAAGLAAGAAAYFAAVSASRRGAHEDFLAFSSIGAAAVLVAAASLSGPAAAAVFLLSGLATAFASIAASRRILALHAAGHLVAAAIASGLFAASIPAFFSTTAQESAPLPVAGFALAAAGAFALLTLGEGRHERGWREALSSSVAASLALLALGVVAVLSLASFPGIGSDAARVAVLRTAILSAAAVGLAFSGRRLALKELGWLSWSVLLLGGLQVLFQDLTRGRAATIFLAFAVYGAALIATPKVLSRRRGQAAAHRAKEPAA